MEGKWKRRFSDAESDATELFPEDEDEIIELLPPEEPQPVQEAAIETAAAVPEAAPVLTEAATIEVAAQPRPNTAEEDDDDDEEDDEDEETEMSPKRRGWVKELISWGMILVISFSIAFFLNEVILINARIVSGSMENTIMTGERVLGTRFAYWFSDPQRQDIVIFRSEDKSSKTLIKRLIGLPGDTIEIYDGVVYVNGEALDEPYLWEEMKGTYGPYVVPEGCYFVLGDNRNNSGDSRYWSNPYIKREEIIGKACFIYWPRLKSLT